MMVRERWGSGYSKGGGRCSFGAEGEKLVLDSFVFNINTSEL